MARFLIQPRGHLESPGFVRVPPDYQAKEGEIVVDNLTPEQVWDEEGQRVRDLFEAEKLEKAKGDHKQDLYREGLITAVRPLMRGNSPDEWQDELFGRMLKAQLTGEVDPTLTEIAGAYSHYNDLADQVDAFTRNSNESNENAINRMKATIEW